MWFLECLEPVGAPKHWLRSTWGGDDEFDADGNRRDLDLEEIKKEGETSAE